MEHRDAPLSQGTAALYRSPDASVWLLDVPRSIEEGQMKPGSGALTRRLVSVRPLSQAFATPEPKDGDESQGVLDPPAQFRELMTIAAVESALQLLQQQYSGPLCLPRCASFGIGDDERIPEPAEAKRDEGSAEADIYIPEDSHHFTGTIQERRDDVISQSPEFDLILLDPPWPNRSARRKKGGYTTAYNAESLRDLLSQIPIAAKLKTDGIVAVWVTNKPALHDLLTSPRGIFAEWGVELVDTWTWIKVTTHGQPIFDLGSTWRKPWEQLLIARRRGSQLGQPRGGRVIVAVPDIHSRKPCLRSLFQEFYPSGYTALEVFARNVTAGWWAWGDEVLRFQAKEHWVDIPADGTTSSAPAV